MSASFEEHGVIVDAVLGHDAAGAQRDMRTHLLSARSAAPGSPLPGPGRHPRELVYYW